MLKRRLFSGHILHHNSSILCPTSNRASIIAIFSTDQKSYSVADSKYSAPLEAQIWFLSLDLSSVIVLTVKEYSRALSENSLEELQRETESPGKTLHGPYRFA